MTHEPEDRKGSVRANYDRVKVYFFHGHHGIEVTFVEPGKATWTIPKDSDPLNSYIQSMGYERLPHELTTALVNPNLNPAFAQVAHHFLTANLELLAVGETAIEGSGRSYAFLVAANRFLEEGRFEYVRQISVTMDDSGSGVHVVESAVAEGEVLTFDVGRHYSSPPTLVEAAQYLGKQAPPELTAAGQQQSNENVREMEAQARLLAKAFQRKVRSVLLAGKEPVGHLGEKTNRHLLLNAAAIDLGWDQALRSSVLEDGDVLTELYGMTDANKLVRVEPLSEVLCRALLRASRR